MALNYYVEVFKHTWEDWRIVVPSDVQPEDVKEFLYEQLEKLQEAKTPMPSLGERVNVTEETQFLEVQPYCTDVEETTTHD
jgi:predicted metal-dependent hydrolase